jgi:hypothetical protein
MVNNARLHSKTNWLILLDKDTLFKVRLKQSTQVQYQSKMCIFVFLKASCTHNNHCDLNGCCLELLFLLLAIPSGDSVLFEVF